MLIDALEVRRALENHEFVPYFQPIVVLRTGHLAGFEVLARWKHPKLGIVAPGEFIPSSEKDGWIGALTQSLLQKTFASAPLIPAPLVLAVNISQVLLRDLTLPQLIRDACKRASFPLERLVIEITETALTENLVEARAIGEQLKAMGCRLALDDFGTGYSSLLHLQSMPFDELKVDRSFVNSMTDRRDNRKIVAAVVGLGQSLGFTTVAEGIETPQQAEMLLWMGCEQGQGWLYGRPFPAEELAASVSAPPRRISTGLPSPWYNSQTNSLDAPPAQRLAQLQAVYDGAPVGLAFLDCNLRHASLNQRLADMHGISVEDHLGRTAVELFPGLAPQLGSYSRRALAGEATAGVEVTMPAFGTQTEKTLLLSYQPVRDEAEEVVGVSLAVVDITELARSKEALRESEGHYREAMTSNPDVSGGADPMYKPGGNQGVAGILIESIQTRESIETSLMRLGFSVVHLSDPAVTPGPASDETGACSLIVVDEDKANTLRKAVLKSSKQNQRIFTPIILLRSASSPENVATDLDYNGILRIPLPSDKLMRRLRDILHAHQALTMRVRPIVDELSMAQRVMNSVTNGIVIADANLPDLPLTYVNPAFEQMTGYTFAEIHGRNCRFLQGGETEQPGLAVIRDAIREQRETRTVLKNYRKDGSPFWNELYLSPIRDSQNRLTHFVGIQNDVTIRVEFEQRIFFLAHHDSLTGVANRGLLFERLQQAVMRASRHNTSVAVVFFDLNNFKHVNDVFGHDAGDVLLSVIARRLQAEVRECDTVARLGGDEFVVLIPDLEEAAQIPALIHRLTEEISRAITIREQEFHPSASVGWSLYPRDGRDPEELLKVADLAMYLDKHKSRQVDQDSELLATPVIQPSSIDRKA